MLMTTLCSSILRDTESTPFAGVYFPALLRRFATTWPSRDRSTFTVTTASGNARVDDKSLLAARLLREARRNRYHGLPANGATGTLGNALLFERVLLFAASPSPRS